MLLQWTRRRVSVCALWRLGRRATEQRPLGRTMQVLAIVLAGVIGSLVVTAAVRSALAYSRRPRRNALAAVGCTLAALGGLGFCGLVFSGFGGLRWLPASLEWPVGSVRGALTMADGTHVVPVPVAGNKVQLYTPDWRFLRGWYVPAWGGGQFHLQLAQSNRFEVITRRNAMRYLYNLDGFVVSEESYAPKAFEGFSESAEKVQVPTRWWLWMFTSPIHPWLVMGAGVLLVLLATRGAKRECHSAQPLSPNGGPAAPLGSSDVGTGPPSVS